MSEAEPKLTKLLTQFETDKSGRGALPNLWNKTIKEFQHSTVIKNDDMKKGNNVGDEAGPAEWFLQHDYVWQDEINGRGEAEIKEKLGHGL